MTPRKFWKKKILIVDDDLTHMKKETIFFFYLSYSETKCISANQNLHFVKRCDWSHHFLLLHKWLLQKIMLLTPSLLYLRWHVYDEIGRPKRWCIRNGVSIIFFQSDTKVPEVRFPASRSNHFVPSLSIYSLPTTHTYSPSFRNIQVIIIVWNLIVEKSP